MDGKKGPLEKGGGAKPYGKSHEKFHIFFVIPSLTSPTSNLRLSCLIDPHLPAIYLNP